MRLSQVNHIDIIANTRAVRGVVIITEDFQFRTQAGSSLRNKRQQVLRHTVRQLTDICRGVRTYRVEIAQDSSVQIAVCVRRIVDNLLVNLLCITVRRERFLDRRRLINGQVLCVRLTVHGARGREHQILHFMQLHHLQQRHEATDIVAVIEERFLYRLTDRFAGRKMDNSHNIRILLEYAIQIYEVAAVDICERRLASYDGGNTVQHIYG